MLSASFTFDSDSFKKKKRDVAVAHADSNLLDFEEYRRTLKSDIDDSRSRELFLEVKNHDQLLWSTFSRQDMVTLATECFTVLKFKDQERIICEGEHATFFCLTLKGYMKVQLSRGTIKTEVVGEEGAAVTGIASPDSKQVSMHSPVPTEKKSVNEYDLLSMQKGSIIGEMAYFDIHSRYRTASICSDGPSTVAIMPYAALQNMHDVDPQLQTKLLSLLGMTSLLKMRDNFQRHMSHNLKALEAQLVQQKKATAAARKKKKPKLHVDVVDVVGMGRPRASSRVGSARPPGSAGGRLGSARQPGSAKYIKPGSASQHRPKSAKFESLFMRRMDSGGGLNHNGSAANSPLSGHGKFPVRQTSRSNVAGMVDEPVLQENYRKNVKDIRRDVELEYSVKYDGRLNTLHEENKALVTENLSLHIRTKTLDAISRATQDKNQSLDKELNEARNQLAVLKEENQRIPELEFKIKQLQLRLTKQANQMTIERKKADGEAQVSQRRMVKTFLLMWKKHSRYVHYQIQLRRRDKMLKERTHLFGKTKELYEEENKRLKRRCFVLERDRKTNRQIIKHLSIEKFVRVFQRKKQLTALYLTIRSFCDKIMELNREYRGRDVQAYTLGAEEGLEKTYNLIQEKAVFLDKNPSIQALFNVVGLAISSLEFDTTDLIRRLNTAAGAFLERNLALCDELERLKDEKGSLYEEACVEVQQQAAQLEQQEEQLKHLHEENTQAREDIRRQRGKQRIESDRKAKVEVWRAIKFAEFTQLAMGKEVQTFDDVWQREQEAKLKAHEGKKDGKRMDFSPNAQPERCRVGFPIKRNKSNVTGGLELRLDGQLTLSNLLSHATLPARHSSKPKKGQKTDRTGSTSKSRLTYDRAASTSVNITRLRPKSAHMQYRRPAAVSGKNPSGASRGRHGRAYDKNILNADPRLRGSSARSKQLRGS
jgi:CRP-like cAMP-binding protein